jgi:serine protease Do
MRVRRNDEVRNVNITLTELPVKQQAAAAEPKQERQKPAPADHGAPHMGVAISDLTPDIIEHLQLPAKTTGVIIADVQEGSPAAEAGLRVGDVIQQIDRKSVNNVDDFRNHVSEHKAGPVLLLVSRDGHTIFVAVDVS